MQQPYRAPARFTQPFVLPLRVSDFRLHFEATPSIATRLESVPSQQEVNRHRNAGRNDGDRSRISGGARQCSLETRLTTLKSSHKQSTTAMLMD